MWHAWGSGEEFTGFRLGGTKVRDHSEDLGTDVKIILEIQGRKVGLDACGSE
jgi:hypothetical protein